MDVVCVGGGGVFENVLASATSKSRTERGPRREGKSDISNSISERFWILSSESEGRFGSRARAGMAKKKHVLFVTC